ncbi:hypothetical protein TNCT_79131 [Trichonephila clavata]|uniref:Uncharacterized protein n=1 Tax=Trichonephila clavata TaxID=2740835 RepID=A0A8X6EZR5_TRICU|nr:hypothetical protein TNCT_79131 [Trichonephila clavata]
MPDFQRPKLQDFHPLPSNHTWVEFMNSPEWRDLGGWCLPSCGSRRGQPGFVEHRKRREFQVAVVESPVSKSEHDGLLCKRRKPWAALPLGYALGQRVRRKKRCTILL